MLFLIVVGIVDNRRGGIEVCFLISQISVALDVPSYCSCHGGGLGRGRGTLMCEQEAGVYVYFLVLLGTFW